jgi:hypothetical protein
VIVAMAKVTGATELIPVVRAHVDGCLFHGPAGLDFAERLAAKGGRVRVPTTLNVSALDLLHPERILLDDGTRELARRQMDAYVEMGCEPTWTCAPYQLPDRPAFGEHIAWAESNAIVFANSVLGARTGRYGDFFDICAAITGRVPNAGLQRDEGRRAQIVLRLDAASREALRASGEDGSDELYGLIGHVVGQESGASVPAIVGLPAGSTEDQLKALGAASASAGAVAMFHAVGVTPEAPTLGRALGGQRPARTIEITAARLSRAWHELSTTGGGGRPSAVCLGTPHYSADQLARLDALLAGRAVAQSVEMYTSTGRDVLAAIAGTGIPERLAQAGVRIVTDTCTYVTAILRSQRGSTVMTDSAKWAWYAPGNLGVKVVYGAIADCVESAVKGRIVRRPPKWLDG